MMAHIHPVVAGEDDQRLLSDAKRVQRVNDSPDPLVHGSYGRVISLKQLAS